MSHIAALTSGSTTPSARFRVRQYIPHLRQRGISVEDHSPALSQSARLPGFLGSVRTRYIAPLAVTQALTNFAFRIPGIVASHRARVTWLERNFVPGLDDLSVVLKRPLVIDIDDSIWLYNPMGNSAVRRLLSRADTVLAGNSFLADWCSNHCKHVEIVPTAVDTSRFTPRLRSNELEAPFTVGWTGTSGNFRFLRLIEPALANFLQRYPTAEFLVVADHKPNLPSLPAQQVKFEPWQATSEADVLRRFDVGIMPLDDSELSRGKCSFKMLQYMAAGVPVVVSPYGMNRDVLGYAEVGVGAVSNTDWTDALGHYCANPNIRTLHGAAGRALAQTRFDTALVAAHIANIFGRYL